MPLFKTVKVATVASDEVTVAGLTSTKAEKRKVLACYPDDSLTTSEFVAYLEQSEKIRFYIDNLVGEASKRIPVDITPDVGAIFYVGYKNPAAVSGDKYVVIEYEIIG